VSISLNFLFYKGHNDAAGQGERQAASFSGSIRQRRLMFHSIFIFLHVDFRFFSVLHCASLSVLVLLLTLQILIPRSV